MDLMEAIADYEEASCVALRHGNNFGDEDAAMEAWAICVRYADRLKAAEAIIAEQADDEDLWFSDSTASGAQDNLQRALLALTAAIEGKP